METEMKPQVKKEWKTPELIVLVRSNPEEAVLTTCKNSTVNAGTSDWNVNCTYGPGQCQLCTALTSS
jgi:hypothetical protein